MHVPSSRSLAPSLPTFFFLLHTHTHTHTHIKCTHCLAYRLNCPQAGREEKGEKGSWSMPNHQRWCVQPWKLSHAHCTHVFCMCSPTSMLNWVLSNKKKILHRSPVGSSPSVRCRLGAPSSSPLMKNSDPFLCAEEARKETYFYFAASFKVNCVHWRIWRVISGTQEGERERGKKNQGKKVNLPAIFGVKMTLQKWMSLSLGNHCISAMRND